MNILVLGPPGSGKGTLSFFLVKEYAFKHIATGDLFRNAIENNTPLGQKITTTLEKGQLVDDKLTNALIQEHLKSLPHWQSVDKIFDGYPRTLVQAQSLQMFCPLEKVFILQIVKERLFERIIHRLICTNCGRTYNTQTAPPIQAKICDKCHGPLTQRKDDTKEILEQRLSVYEQETLPLIKFYQEQGIVVNLNADQDLQELLKEFYLLLALGKK